MSYPLSITSQERAYLRELARKQRDYAAWPVMEERKALWYRHNSLQGERPVVVMEMDTFEEDMLPPPRCISPAAVEIEKNLLRHIVNLECIGDDKVVPDYYTVDLQIQVDEFGVEISVEHAVDMEGRSVGYAWRHPIKTLRDDLSRLKPFTYSLDQAGTQAQKSLAEDVLGDILPARVKNNSLRWYVALSHKIVRLMGMENMLVAMLDEPEAMHALCRYVRDNVLAFIRWQEEEGLLTLNNENDYTGAGSYGFTTELPAPGHRQGQPVTTRDLWLNMNSQESVGISPQMYGAFVFPYYRDIADIFGLVYYGCCEPVHTIWESYVSRLPHLRKVSVSAWCDEEFMGEALRGSRVIYSRKPSPNFIGVGTSFDAEGFRRSIRQTLKAARGCTLEFIFRDVYTLSGDRTKPGRAVEITRELIADMW